MKPEIDCPHRGWRRLHQATHTALLFCGTLALSAMAGEASGPGHDGEEGGDVVGLEAAVHGDVHVA